MLELLFGFKWWDYHKNKNNINGRIYLSNYVVYGIFSYLVIYVLNPLFKLINISLFYKKIILIILLIIFIVDIIISIIEAIRIKDIVPCLDKIINEYNKNHNIKINRINTRLLDAYPYLTHDNPRIVKKIKSLKKEFVELKKL